jgi:transposase InsO family protein
MGMKATKHRNRRADSMLARLKKTVLDEQLDRCLSVRQASGLLQMHPKAFLRLKLRYKREGMSALWPKKPGPKKGSCSSVKRTPKNVEDTVVEWSLKYPYLGPAPLARMLKQTGIVLHQTTVWRILCRRTDRYASGRKRWKQNPKLYALEEPGAEVQMDACYPFGRAREVAVFDALDDCSRFGCADVYASEDLPSAKAFIRKLVRTSPFRIRSIRLDNRFHGPTLVNFCRYYGIRLIFNEPYHPEQNGKIERYHRTFKREAVWRTMSFHDSMKTLRYKTALWIQHYNFERPHGGLSMNNMTPVQKLQSVYLSKIIYPQPVTLSLQQYIF